ncbi:MAG: hypothetical protein M3N47_00260 [Chloroflexota bacterium]|nr:hypothetical protein [Chloroflexota bacterium]
MSGHGDHRSTDADAGLWLVASVTGMVALSALYVAERTRTGRQAPGVKAEPPPLAAPAD